MNLKKIVKVSGGLVLKKLGKEVNYKKQGIGCQIVINSCNQQRQ